MGNEHEPLTRTMKNNRRKTREDQTKNKKLNRTLNSLIFIVSALIIISLVIILTNDNLKNDIAKNESAKENSAVEQSNSNTTGENNRIQSSNDTESNEGESVESENQDGSEEDVVQVEVVSSADTNVKVAWVNPEWAPHETAQTGGHTNSFDAKNIDYQEKLNVLYNDTNLSEETSILWNIKNASGDAVAVISTKDKKQIYRLTMTWVDGQGWKTTLLEQLNSLDGAY